jgi:hypothetical protein
VWEVTSLFPEQVITTTTTTTRVIIQQINNKQQSIGWCDGSGSAGVRSVSVSFDFGASGGGVDWRTNALLCVWHR